MGCRVRGEGAVCLVVPSCKVFCRSHLDAGPLLDRVDSDQVSTADPNSAGSTRCRSSEQRSKARCREKGPFR